MYQVMGWKALASLAAIVTLIVFVLWVLLSQPSSPWEYISIGLRSVPLAVGTLAFCGQTLPLVPWIASWSWVQRFLPNIFPHLDGKWRAKLTSNWPKIAAARDLPTGAGAAILADVKITVRLFTVRVELLSDTKYSESETEAVSVLKNLEHGDIRLHYIYRNDTPEAKDTDSGVHRGAASLKLKRPDKSLPYLDGHYWTNRNWEKGLNTAGRISMWRHNDPASEAKL